MLTALLSICILNASCAINRDPVRISSEPEEAQTEVGVTPSLAGNSHEELYDPDPNHLWNQVYRIFFIRSDQERNQYGWDSVDPLLWRETKFLLETPSYEKAIALLDQFLITGAQDLVTDPLKRAMFQYDLWAVFDWLTLNPEDYPGRRRQLESRLAKIIHSLELKDQEISQLPDNYATAAKSGMYPKKFPGADSNATYLPPDLFDSNGPWGCLGRQDDLVAPVHIQDPSILGRSVFFAFLRLPEGRVNTLQYLAKLRDAKSVSQAPEIPAGSQVALVRQALLINNHDQLLFSRLTLSVQIRYLDKNNQRFFEFKLNRAKLFAGQPSLIPIEGDNREFMTFMDHGFDYFDSSPNGDAKSWMIQPLKVCEACHMTPSISYILTYSHLRFAPEDAPLAVLSETDPQEEAQKTIAWKQEQTSWHLLQNFWKTNQP